ncbi:MAG TPA: DUF4328 domain-containing protein [Planctomycetota bacterium]|nr:DUF4328 domain-containing protein [Planctomycetota bacterium]
MLRLTAVSLGLSLLSISFAIKGWTEESELINSEDFVVSPDFELSLTARDNLDTANMVVGILCLIVFLVWEVRANRNLFALTGQPPRHSSAAVVVWWFVPIAHWFMPYIILREIWSRSRPSAAPSLMPLFNAMWFTAILMELLLYAHLYASFSDLEWYWTNVFDIGGEAVGLVTAVLSFVVVQRMSADQKQTAEALARAPAQEFAANG